MFLIAISIEPISPSDLAIPNLPSFPLVVYVTYSRCSARCVASALRTAVQTWKEELTEKSGSEASVLVDALDVVSLLDENAKTDGLYIDQVDAKTQMQALTCIKKIGEDAGASGIVKCVALLPQWKAVEDAVNAAVEAKGSLDTEVAPILQYASVLDDILTFDKAAELPVIDLATLQAQLDAHVHEVMQTIENTTEAMRRTKLLECLGQTIDSIGKQSDHILQWAAKTLLEFIKIVSEDYMLETEVMARTVFMFNQLVAVGQRSAVLTLKELRRHSIFKQLIGKFKKPTVDVLEKLKGSHPAIKQASDIATLVRACRENYNPPNTTEEILTAFFQARDGLQRQHRSLSEGPLHTALAGLLTVFNVAEVAKARLIGFLPQVQALQLDVACKV